MQVSMRKQLQKIWGKIFSGNRTLLEGGRRDIVPTGMNKGKRLGDGTEGEVHEMEQAD